MQLTAKAQQLPFRHRYWKVTAFLLSSGVADDKDILQFFFFVTLIVTGLSASSKKFQKLQLPQKETSRLSTPGYVLCSNAAEKTKETGKESTLKKTISFVDNPGHYTPTS